MWGVNSVYRNTLGWNKEQAEIVAKIDEICQRYNELPKYIQDAINEALENFDPSGGTDDHTQLTNRDAEDQHPQSAITGLVSALAAKYVLPTGGIPAADLANAVQTSLGKADSAYQLPSSGIPAADMTNAVQTSLGKADSAYQKPSSGIPSSDMTNAVQSSLGKADTALQSVPDLSATYVTVAQEIADAGKVLGINDSGNVVPVSVGGGGYPEWKSITNFTTTEEVSQFIISSDDNNNPLRLHEFAIRIDFVQPQTPKTGTMYVEATFENEAYKPNVCSLSYNTTTGDHVIFYNESITKYLRKAAATAGANANIQIAQVYGNHGDILTPVSPITQIRIFGADFGTGTVVSIVGR